MQRHSGSEPLECFRRYADAFQALDPKAVARHFHEPSLLISPHGVASLRTIAEVEDAYTAHGRFARPRLRGNRVLVP